MLLLIDTSGEKATVMLSAGDQMLAYAENNVARDHSAWLHPAIAELISRSTRNVQEIEAVAVSAGPGSYTGLRVGMAAAKGFCFTLSVPMIACNSLLLMAASMIPLSNSPAELLCPMTDARRAEVFTALYTHDLEAVRPPAPMILDKTSFEAELARGPVLFAGSGSVKWKQLCSSPSANFSAQPDVKQSFIRIATGRFLRGEWTDVVYSEPEYGKEFQTHVIN